MNFVAGVLATLGVLTLIISFTMLGIDIGQQRVATELRDCLAISSAEGVCDNRILDKYLPKEGN
jgi:hypothetical protein